MQIKDGDIEQIIKNTRFEMHEIHNNIWITKTNIDILASYGFNIENFKNTKELIFAIENHLNYYGESKELENVLYELSEFDYYHNTNK